MVFKRIQRISKKLAEYIAELKKIRAESAEELAQAE